MNGIYLICQNCQEDCKGDSSKWVAKTVRKIVTKSCQDYKAITKTWLLEQAIEQERLMEGIANDEKEKNKIKFREKILDLQTKV